MYYLLLFYCNSGCMNTPQCYVVCTSPVLFRWLNLLDVFGEINKKFLLFVVFHICAYFSKSSRNQSVFTSYTWFFFFIFKKQCFLHIRRSFTEKVWFNRKFGRLEHVMGKHSVICLYISDHSPVCDVTHGLNVC
jgi:hypothetical protein